MHNKAVLSNHHTLQLIQANHFHFLYIRKALITHFKQSQIGHETQIESSPFGSITTVMTHDQVFNVVVKE